jgi:hypothetical protein
MALNMHIHETVICDRSDGQMHYLITAEDWRAAKQSAQRNSQ